MNTLNAIRTALRVVPNWPLMLKNQGLQPLACILGQRSNADVNGIWPGCCHALGRCQQGHCVGRDAFLATHRPQFFVGSRFYTDLIWSEAQFVG